MEEIASDVRHGLRRLAGGLESLLFGVTARDALAFAGAPLLLSAVALLACLAPALRASRIPPMETLRAD